MQVNLSPLWPLDTKISKVFNSVTGYISPSLCLEWHNSMEVVMTFVFPLFLAAMLVAMAIWIAGWFGFFAVLACFVVLGFFSLVTWHDRKSLSRH